MSTNSQNRIDGAMSTSDMKKIQATVEKLVQETLKKRSSSGFPRDKEENFGEKREQAIQTDDVIFKFSGAKGNKHKYSRNGSTGASIVKNHFSDFWSNISLPGMKYVGENGQNSLDRYVWLFVLVVSVIVSCQYIHNSYNKWKSSPVLLSFNDSLTPISAVPFPAVTVCPGRQLTDTFISDLELAASECTDRDSCSASQWNLLSGGELLCLNSGRLEIKSKEKYLEGNIDKVVKGLASNCTEDVAWYKLNGDEYSYDCSSHFQTLLVEGEVCFTFNMLPARHLFKDNVTFPMVDTTKLESKPNWTLDNMLELADLSRSVPRYIYSNGRWAGLYFEMDKKSPIKQTLCGQPTTTTKVVFHHPAEIPLPETHKFYDLSRSNDYFIHVTPRLITSSHELVDYTPQDRRCHYSNERVLSLFRSYSQRNCQLECRVNCSLSLCDCVPHYLPRHNDSVKICGRHHTQLCAELYLTAILEGRYTWRDIVVLYRESVGDRIQTLFKDYQVEWPGGLRNVTDQLLQETYPDCRCECPVACSSLGYDVEVKQQPLPSNLPPRLTRLAISFKELEFTSVLRKELIGLTDFIADSGGVLGVFTGFTFLAVVELLYYLTLRLWKNIKHACEEMDNPNAEDVGADATD